MNYKNIKKELIENGKNVCEYCGKTLTYDEINFDHIIPCSKGGKDTIDNIAVSCRRCNIRKADNIWGYQFEQFIVDLLESSEDYKNIRRNVILPNSKRDIDIIFEKKSENSKMYVAEVKFVTAFTKNRLEYIIQQFEPIKAEYPNADYLFIFPGVMPESYYDLLVANKLTVWDRNKLCELFPEKLSELESFPLTSLIQNAPKKNNQLDKYQKAIKRLKECPEGIKDWSRYQTLVGEIMAMLFCPPLLAPIPQSSDNSKNNRRDFVLPNYEMGNGIWKYLRETYDAMYVVVDAKNSSKYITKNDVLQISNYLKKGGVGQFGIIISRKGSGKSSNETLREKWLCENKMIVVLDDNDVEQMLLNKRDNIDPAELIRKKIEDFRLSI